jgi:hypothetical protein
MGFLAIVFAVAVLGLLVSIRTSVRDIQEKVKKLLLLLIVFSGVATASAEELQTMQLSPETRNWFFNSDGSCVQCSIGMAGIHCNDPNAASLLWDTRYGPAERFGSLPSRVEAYCDRRGIKAWSVTSNSVEDTLTWLEWATKTGRFAACGAGQAHFQTVYGRDRENRFWLVCNNQTPRTIDRYTDAQFRELHSAVKWVVILEKSSSLPPELPHNWK